MASAPHAAGQNKLTGNIDVAVHCSRLLATVPCTPYLNTDEGRYSPHIVQAGQWVQMAEAHHIEPAHQGREQSLGREGYEGAQDSETCFH